MSDEPSRKTVYDLPYSGGKLVRTFEDETKCYELIQTTHSGEVRILCESSLVKPFMPGDIDYQL